MWNLSIQKIEIPPNYECSLRYRSGSNDPLASSSLPLALFPSPSWIRLIRPGLDLRSCEVT